jgi:putative ATPase
MLGEVPPALGDSHYQGAAKLGHGGGYLYPHDDPRGWVPQEYRPKEVAERRYYEPSGHGAEAEVARRDEARRNGATDEPATGPADRGHEA